MSANKDIYLFYSGATDTTGVKLAESLMITGGKVAPKTGVKVVIGWGTKTDEAVKFGKDVVVLNHPDAIRANRNKLAALQAMANAGVAVAPFIDSNAVLKELDKKVGGKISVPCIGRTNYHQGGAGFFTCLTVSHVKRAIADLEKLGKKGYFQNYIDVETEYRLHIFDGKCIVAAKKVERTDHEDAYVDQQKEKVVAMAEKKGEKIDPKTLDFALKYQAGKLGGSDQIIKSNTRGWKFSPVKDTQVPKGLIDEAVKAVAALKLDFGAVDCVVDVNKKVWVIEVNSGPGLEGTSYDAYVNAFVTKLKSIFAPAKKEVVEAKPAVRATVGPLAPTSKTDVSAEKLRLLADMLDKASDVEKRTISAVAKRMFE